MILLAYRKYGIGLLLLGTVITGVVLFPKLSDTLQMALFASVSMLFLGSSAYLLKHQSQVKRHSNSRRFYNRRAQPDALVVDDDEANRRIADEYLTGLGLKTLTADSGKHALLLCQKYPFKLLFIDIEMGEMSGIETVAILRKQQQQRLPIIAVSAHSDSEKKLQALTAGFDDYLTKPIDEEKLTQVLERWLEPKDVDKTGSQPGPVVPDMSAAPEIQKTGTTIANEILSTPRQQTSLHKQDKSSHKVVDIQQSLAFSHNNPRLAKDMLLMLITMVKKQKGIMCSHFEQGEWQELTDLAHKLNGGSCYCGVGELQSQAEILEKQLLQQDYDEAAVTFPRLIAAMEALLQWHDEHDLDIIFEP